MVVRRSIPALLVAALLGQCTRVHPSERSLAVHAASSLTEPFTELAAAFERTHPGVDVELTFAGSQVLRLQIEQGATADVFASANEEHVEALVAANLVADRRIFARNELAVIVPDDNPAAIRSFADLPRARRIVLGVATVPVGAYARRALSRAEARYGADFIDRVQRRVVSEESNVRLVRAKVLLGEADAAIVYATDAVGQPGLRAFEVPQELGVFVRYPIAVLARTSRPALAARFVAFVCSETGRAILASFGFAPEAS